MIKPIEIENVSELPLGRLHQYEGMQTVDECIELFTHTYGGLPLGVYFIRRHTGRLTVFLVVSDARDT